MFEGPCPKFASFVFYLVRRGVVSYLLIGASCWKKLILGKQTVLAYCCPFILKGNVPFAFISFQVVTWFCVIMSCLTSNYVGIECS